MGGDDRTDKLRGEGGGGGDGSFGGSFFFLGGGGEGSFGGSFLFLGGAGDVGLRLPNLRGGGTWGHVHVIVIEFAEGMDS